MAVEDLPKEATSEAESDERWPEGLTEMSLVVMKLMRAKTGGQVQCDGAPSSLGRTSFISGDQRVGYGGGRTVATRGHR